MTAALYKRLRIHNVGFSFTIRVIQMEKFNFVKIFAFTLFSIVVFSVKGELGDEACSCNTLDGDAGNYLCQPVSEFVSVGTTGQTNQGSELYSSLYGNQKVIFTGIDINLNGDIIYENGQSDSDVVDPVKKFFTKASSDISGQTNFILQFGRDDSNIRAHWVKVAADPALVNKAATSIIKLVKKFADVAAIRIPLLSEYGTFR